MNADIRQILMHSMFLPRRLELVAKDWREVYDRAADQEEGWDLIHLPLIDEQSQT
jgi:hypothetical protein